MSDPFIDPFRCHVRYCILYTILQYLKRTKNTSSGPFRLKIMSSWSRRECSCLFTVANIVLMVHALPPREPGSMCNTGDYRYPPLHREGMGNVYRMALLLVTVSPVPFLHGHNVYHTYHGSTQWPRSESHRSVIYPPQYFSTLTVFVTTEGWRFGSFAFWTCGKWNGVCHSFNDCSIPRFPPTQDFSNMSEFSSRGPQILSTPRNFRRLQHWW